MNCKFCIFSLMVKVSMIFSGVLANGLKILHFLLSYKNDKKVLTLNVFVTTINVCSVEHNFCQLFPYTCSRSQSACQSLLTNFGYVLEISQLLLVLRKIISVLYYHSLYICQFQNASQCGWMKWFGLNITHTLDFSTCTFEQLFSKTSPYFEPHMFWVPPS